MRKIFGFLVLVLAGVLFGGVVFAAGEGETATANSETKIAEKSQGEMSPAAETDNSVETSEASVDYQEKLVEGKLESFENRVDGLQWTMTTALTAMGLILGILGLFAFKQGREYKEAVAKAGSEADKAEGYAKNARDWEEKAQKKYNDFEKESREKLTQFDKKAEDKFAQLEKKAEKQLEKTTEDSKKDIADESKKLRELNKKWNEAYRAGSDGYYEKACRLWKEVVQQDEDDYTAWNNWGIDLANQAETDKSDTEKFVIDACEKFAVATSIQNDTHEVYNNWGLALKKWGLFGGPNAEMRFIEACKKFEKAVLLENKSYEVYGSWGSCLLRIGTLKTGQERESFFNDAQDKFLKAEEIKTGEGAYDLACVYALRGDKEKCREWLKVGEEAGTLRPTRKHAETDEDLKSAWGEAWFKEIRWKGEK